MSQSEYSDVVRFGILRDAGSETMVGTISIASVAGYARAIRQRCHTWSGEYIHTFAMFD